MSTSFVFNRRKLAIVGHEQLNQPLIDALTMVSSSVGVMLVDKDDIADSMHGSAFCVDARGLFMTAFHYLRGFRTATLLLDREYAAEPVAVDEEKDLALFSINPATPLQPLRFAASLPAPGTNLVGVGHVMREGYVALGAYAVSYLDRLEAVISAESRADIDPERLECSLVMVGSGLNIPGFSGGPLLNALGQVEALTSGGDGDSYVTAISAAAAQELTAWYVNRTTEAKTA
jgi:S1-C subfamily serine protease